MSASVELHSWHDDVLKATVVHHVNAADWKRMMTIGGGSDTGEDSEELTSVAFFYSTVAHFAKFSKLI